METNYKLDTKDMEEYLQSYDALRQKYFWDIDKDVHIPSTLIRQAVALGTEHKSTNEIWNFSDAQSAYLTAKKVYDDNKTSEHLAILQLIMGKFICDFTGIEGISHLFKASYFDFEWMMHLEYDSDKHDYTKYRDHYIHQIRNMYEMFVLLDDCGFMEYCIKSYQNNSNIVANRIESSIREQIRSSDGRERGLFRNTLNFKGQGKSNEAVQIRMEECYYRYLIHAVAIIAALTHDIGYPINYMLRITKKLHKFLPLSEAFLHLNDAMPHLEEILQESLLYQAVSSREIAKRVRDKQDHGAISAVILLSQYYETGAIYHLRPIERMVIELSALVIYNHTLHYEYMTGEKESRYRNLFGDNPISYLFRLCDDLQEWERVYFDISKGSNFLVCPKCHMPITRLQGSSIYSCGCGDTGIKETKFAYRKLTNISACVSLKIKDYEEKGVDKVQEDATKRRIIITLEYDMVSLLQLSLYSPQFAKQRSDGIYEIKRMLDDQRELPDIYVEAFLSNNPIAIKVKCLEQYLKYEKNIELNKVCNIDEDLKKSISAHKVTESEVIELLEKNISILYNSGLELERDVIQKLERYQGKSFEKKEAIIKKWQQNLEFYAFLAVLGKAVEQLRKYNYLLDRDKAIDFSKQLANKIVDTYAIRDRMTKALIMDYIWQRIRNISAEELFDKQSKYYDNKKQYYYEAALSTQFMTNVVKEYTGSDDYSKVKEKLLCGKVDELAGIYDFYTDYELFQLLFDKTSTSNNN